MNIIDLIIILCIIPAVIQGLRKGFIAQVIAIISIILGFWLSFKFADMFSVWLGTKIPGSEQVLKITAFAIILILVILGLWCVGKLLETTIKIVMLGWLNRLLGVVFALLKTVLIVGLLILAFSALNDMLKLVDRAYLDSSVLYYPLKNIADSVFPYLKELIIK